MNLYFDTSALVKLVVVEDGSDLVAELWATRHPATTSVLAYAEGRAALAAAWRSRRLTAADHGTAVADFEAIQAELVLIGADPALVRDAGELAAQFGLRGDDAVHLASALAPAGLTTMISWDQELRRAASGCGCAVAPAP